MRKGVGGAAGSEIFYGAMQGVMRERAVGAFSFELLRAHFGAQMHWEASRSAMLIERTGAHAGAPEAQDHRASIETRCGEELALQPLQAHRAFAPRLARALSGEAANRAGQLAHQGVARARDQSDD